MNIKAFPGKIKSFIVKCKRVWLVLRKPSKEEYKTIAKVAAIGVLLLGLLGFLVAMIMKIFVK